MADYYVDNNDTIYASVKTFTNGTIAGSNTQTQLELDDIPIVSGQSSVFVNSLRIQFQGTAASGGVGESYGWLMAGIVPADSGLVFDQFIDFQDIKGWPIKGSKKYYHAYTGDTANSGNRINLIHTYKPRRSLLINRNQKILISIYNSYGQNITGLLSMVAQFKRGN